MPFFMLTIQNLHAIFLQYPVISTDTRNIIPNSIFFALKGESFDGNNFVEEALEKGAAFVVSERSFAQNKQVFTVPDVLDCLQQLANFHRNTFKIPVLTITGSNGKTTTKELTKAVLSQKFEVLATEGNLNNHIGVPLTLLKLNSTHEFAIIETGANHPGEIDFLCKIANPDYGLITNIGKAHLEGFGSYEGVVQTKTEMYRFLKAKNGLVFVNANNNLLFEKSENLNRILYGKPEFDISAEIIESNPFAVIKLQYKKSNQSIIIKTNLAGSYNVDNILTAASVGAHFGITAEEIKTAIEAYEPTNKRSQIANTERNMLWIDA
ncbi:MAG TPA: UDP-N-acetylmuramoyl-tripeptide--D-alanyl-D-alanine ligase, partial [Bacteroidales bacterium]|nr:UDP-N-acetylmuramoyl-tripeptide--D-alanyl-D-alanine ligase [Bacteroidales bacterium]